MNHEKIFYIFIYFMIIFIFFVDGLFSLILKFMYNKRFQNGIANFQLFTFQRFLILVKIHQFHNLLT